MPINNFVYLAMEAVTLIALNFFTNSSLSAFIKTIWKHKLVSVGAPTKEKLFYDFVRKENKVLVFILKFLLFNVSVHSTMCNLRDRLDRIQLETTFNYLYQTAECKRFQSLCYHLCFV